MMSSSTDEMKVIKSARELELWRNSSSGRVGLVMTMGALHEGHLELVRYARAQVDHLVVSIFVNPTQFGPNEDFSKYPRQLEQDIVALGPYQADIVYCPTVEDIYPKGHSSFIEETKRSRLLCGQFRPGHFRGVCTVVHKVFQQVKPDMAVFGLKDAQQFFVIQKMTTDLGLDIEIHGHPTVREKDELAMSSRNAYLSSDEREKAAQIYPILKGTADLLFEGVLVRDALKKGKEALEQRGFEIQYLDLVTLPDLEEIGIPKIPRTEPYLLAAAVFLGKTRLIDNIIIGEEILASRGLRR